MCVCVFFFPSLILRDFRSILGHTYERVFRFHSHFHLIYLILFCSVEYNVSYVYHAMYAYFDRDNVALKGLAK